jgi:uncharacterized protein
MTNMATNPPPSHIHRTLQPVLTRLARGFPVVTLTGPRQAGKTTLCRTTFPNHRYVSLEAPDIRLFASRDPRAFLSEFADGAIVDEVQRVPELLSYLQPLVDADPRPGRFVLTGSETLSLGAATAQSLAGRTAVARLLPLSREEVRSTRFEASSLFETLWRGGYPALFSRELEVVDWLSAYLTTLVERDLRQLAQVGDLLTFQAFLGLTAGRAGSLLNMSALGADAGVSHTTARNWLSVLESMFLVFRLAPWHRNIGKRLVKMPKLYFWDTGLLCYLLGIRAPEQLRTHPLRGQIFENWVVSELAKAEYHRGREPRMWFYRDQQGVEIDVILEGHDGDVRLIEVKSGQTLGGDAFDGLIAGAGRWGLAADPRPSRRILVYGGDEQQRRTAAEVWPWHQVDGVGGGGAQ